MKKTEESFRLLTGKDAWSTAEGCGIPSLRVSDGPHGLRYVVREENGIQIAENSTCYPTLSALGNSFDTRLVYRVGEALAEDCILHDVAILLGPGVNLKRTPLCGRNFEYFSEDGVLAGTLAKAYIEGVQSKGVGTSLKHFAANNREYDRFFQSSEMDERTLRETYCRPFEIALEAKPWTVMCSYNPVNGVYASENRHLLHDILRDALGFDGVIVSDWGAVRHRAKSLRAGIDLAMPYSADFEGQLAEWYQKGLITDNEVKSSADRIGALAQKYAQAASLRKAERSAEEKHALSADAATRCAVLLKNEEEILPLAKEKTVALIGAFADKVKAILYMGYGGEGVNEAAAKLLSGEAVPCGKLAESFPQNLRQTATGEERGNSYTERYREGVLVGYKFYEYYDLKPAYSFGHGLSYTRFEYGNLRLEKHGETDYSVRFTVKNMGKYDAEEIVQLYLADDAAMVTRPKKELVRFAKEWIPSGGEREFVFRLSARDFSYFNPNTNDRYVENGTFTLFAGASSADVRLSAKITVRLPEEEQFSQY